VGLPSCHTTHTTQGLAHQCSMPNAADVRLAPHVSPPSYDFCSSGVNGPGDGFTVGMTGGFPDSAAGWHWVDLANLPLAGMPLFDSQRGVDAPWWVEARTLAGVRSQRLPPRFVSHRRAPLRGRQAPFASPSGSGSIPARCNGLAALALLRTAPQASSYSWRLKQHQASNCG
jgi:hypothetical protein